MNQCPCCDYLTIEVLGEFDICPVCGWEDDGTDPTDPQQLDAVPGPNHATLREARKEFNERLKSGNLPAKASEYIRKERKIPL